MFRVVNHAHIMRSLTMSHTVPVALLWPGTKSIAARPPHAQRMVDILGSILSQVHHEISKRPMHSDTVLWLAPRDLLRPVANDQISCEGQVTIPWAQYILKIPRMGVSKLWVPNHVS